MIDHQNYFLNIFFITADGTNRSIQNISINRHFNSEGSFFRNLDKHKFKFMQNQIFKLGVDKVFNEPRSASQ